MTLRCVSKITIAVGGTLVTTSVAIYLQAYYAWGTPGVDDIGSGIAFVLYGPTILTTGAAGLLTLFLGASMLAFQQMREGRLG
jgi:hypothetical protein